MDFAKKQLEKYGWSEGKGLGKHENGISQALKPKIKRSVTGVGHDPASEFNEHWWSALYDKAAGNVEVEEENGKTKKIKTKDDLTISTNTWQISKGSTKESKEQYSDFFVCTAILGEGGNKVEKVKGSDSEDDAEMEKKDVFKMSDEELFAACGGRTAHKGARHGLHATGKLARIAQQEAMLLSHSRYNGYSHAKQRKEPIDDITLNPEEDVECKKKKKKKKRRCFSNEMLSDENCGAERVAPLPIESISDTSRDVANSDNGRKNISNEIVEEMESEESIKSEKNKKRKIKSKETESMETDILETGDVENINKKKKKKKMK